jgi:hypothetical protein
LLGTNDVFFHRFALKSKGRIQTAGWAFLICAAGWIGLNAHSGWIHYHEIAGTRAFQKIRIPDELALAQVNPAPWIGPAEKQDVLTGESHLQTALTLGYSTIDVPPNWSGLNTSPGAAERSSDFSAQAAERQRRGPGL